MYPKIDLNRCIDCHLCEKACPYISRISKKEERHIKQPIVTLATKNLDPSIVRKSSSGGVFYELAKSIIDQNGIVFGAILSSDAEVIHTHTDSKEGLDKMMGSKYVQSHIGNSFREVEEFLKQGLQVLFSGTPCQIAGLRDYLRKDYINLITVDFICHGVPSPGIWKNYIAQIAGTSPFKSSNRNYDIQFREKDGFNWSNYGFKIKMGDETVYSDYAVNNPYLRAFITDHCLRPSCYNCKYKLDSGSDITLGDFWGIDKIAPELYDEDGVSIVIINTQKGAELMPYKKFVTKEVSYQNAIQYNRAITSSSHKPITRNKFFRLAANPKYTLDEVVKKLAPVESQLTFLEKIYFMPTKGMRFINRKLMNK